MKTLTYLLVLSLLSINTLKADEWMHSLEDAKKIAIATNKLILVDFWAVWCGPCIKMDRESWSHQDVKLLMENFVLVKIDITRNTNIAQRYSISRIPYIFILDGNGKILFANRSYIGKKRVMSMLTKYQTNTSFLSNELANYHNKQNFTTAFQLGSKYQDFSLYVNDDIKRDFLNLSSQYFKEAKRLLKKEKNLNKTVFRQRLKLFKIQEDVILGKTKKALNALDKLDHSKIEKINTSFFNFLTYSCYVLNGDAKSANELKGKITERELKKVGLFQK